MQDRDTVHQKSGKANFDQIYDLEDPREYYNTLGEFDYCVPRHGQRVFRQLARALQEERAGTGSRAKKLAVVDVCCSYGINAALLKHDLTLDDLYARYGSAEVAGLSCEELIEADAAFYRERRMEGAPETVGVDIAPNAVSYGVRSGLLDAGFAENLEEGEPTEDLGRAVAGTDLLTVTGGIGYVSQRTFDKLLDRATDGAEGGAPWVAAFALRWVSYGEISDVLAEHGLVTQKLPGHTFTQRRFTGDEERDYVLGELAGMGVDPAGKEDEGWYHADFYLSRPAEQAGKPVEELLAPVL
ncbi:hypothetical protein GBA65_16560 [Rubrobacter marinus]|uniref:Methyltransferase type 12 n=1 Tax=Rubrobacter marinus TaxID=2653852 RepID=A0A6G8Q082_9ACTN|nr:hypothetical protein [Rubrobacter marinus]QIN79872.1 hypothetical protein GBA65_16560 [Rubrobacter marinus]